MRTGFVVPGLFVSLSLACGGRLDPASSSLSPDAAATDAGSASATSCNALPIPAVAEDLDVIGNAPFYTHATFVGVPVPDGRWILVARRAWRPTVNIAAPAYAGPIAAVLDVHGDTWDWAEDDGGVLTRHTYTVTEEEGRYLRLTPSCGGGDAPQLGVIRRGTGLSLYEFLKSSGGISVPVELAFIRQ